MNTPDDCASLDAGDIRLYDNYLPTLEVGDYLINVTQRVNPANTTIDECYAGSQPFSVQGPRYTLPTEDIFSVFPPRNALGIFDQYLPHVVLTKQDLPWERDVFADETLGNQTPWMALLLFTEDEVQLNAGDSGKLLLIPQMQTWTRNQTMSAIIPAADFHASHSGDEILWPDMQPEWYETDDYLQSTNCTVIDISAPAFTTLIPAKTDLPYLAHVRQVDASAKDSEVLRVNGDGWYSVIVGNRLPAAPALDQPPKRNIVHLVSLEGFADYINGTTPLGNATRVRMISFASWTFTCHPELNESFAELMNGLLSDNTVRPPTPKSTSFILPVSAPLDDSADAQYSYRSIQSGYVPLRYQTRLGVQTFAWYRGPLSPTPVNNFISASQQTPNDPARWQPFDTASSALIYDKDRGLFDVSYAVAWETGRLLALSNGHFGQELLDWQRKGHSLIDMILERKSQIAALKNFDPNNPDPAAEKDLLDQIKAYAMTGDFMTYLITQFSQQITPKLYDQPPDPPDAPFPAYPDLPSPPINPQTVADLLLEIEVQEAVREVGGIELDDITDWLAQLYLLDGVPFENLVPNALLLPPESVRFFYLDSNWLDALIEGALSIGIESSRDRLYQDLMKDLIWDTTFTTMQQVRDNLLGPFAQTKPPGSSVPFDQESLSGLLLRSTVVSGWPGLEINGYANYTVDSKGNIKPDLSSYIKLLRMERLSSDVMLCLWPTVPAVVTINEPNEGVAFGFEDPPSGEGDYLYLRSVDPGNYGALLSSDHAIDGSTVIDPATRIIKISASGGLLDSITKELPNSPAIRVRDFALQMIKVPEQAIFAAPQSEGQKQHG